MTETVVQMDEKMRGLMNKEGKYLTFVLGSEEYGLEIMKVREIMGYLEVTSIPQTPHHVRGVINLRGQVIPVIDLRVKFGMETVETTDATCIIVVEVSQNGRDVSVGVIVDQVSEVLDIAGEDIEDAPDFGGDVNTDFILGMAKVEDSVKTLLDIDRVLGNVEFDNLDDADNSQTEQSDQPQDQQPQEQEQQQQ